LEYIKSHKRRGYLVDWKLKLMELLYELVDPKDIIEHLWIDDDEQKEIYTEFESYVKELDKLADKLAEELEKTDKSLLYDDRI
jgi:hypothetical protein